MGKYGFKIKNIQAGSLYGVNLGIRDNLDMKDAMLTNSLFLDFLVENGLTTYKDVSTRDVICLEFSYGCRGYEEEVDYLKKKIKELEVSDLSEAEKNERGYKLSQLLIRADENKDKFCKKSKEEIRELFYVEGVDVPYPTYNKKGEVVGADVIHYKMLYRTPGKAKKGSCMFINQTLFDKARDFLYMGIKLPKKNAPIVEIGAYSSLITSTIVGRIQIEPENILILKDYDSFFTTNVVCIETDENKHCYAERRDGYTLKNTLFDGQALIDESIFPEWAHGYVLLRHHMTKTAAFCTKIQRYFAYKFGNDYDTATVTDMFGNEHLAKDIKLITTDNAVKWLKFGVSYEYWCEWVHKNDCMFGVVKTCHQSKLGSVQRMSYQMVNSMEQDLMPDICATTLEYVKQLKSDNDVFLDYLRLNDNFSNDFNVLVALCEHNPEFARSEYFRERKKDIIKAYMLNFKNGRAIQNGDNLVIVGNPYGMLMYSVGENPEEDPTFCSEDGAIQVFTKRFDDDEYLAAFRSPFNSKNNMDYLHNVYSDEMFEFFNFAPEIIAVNMVHTDFQDHNNGSDQDSDSIYTTNNPAVVACAKYCYANYPTIVNNIPKEANHYDLSLESYAAIDNKLAAAQLAIGESSNLAQICLTYTYNFADEKFSDYVCILSVVAQAAIDNAKRAFDIDIMEEISRIKQDMDIKENGYPNFWGIIRKGFNTGKINQGLECPMNYIYDINTDIRYRSSDSTLPMSEFFVQHKLDSSRRQCRKVEDLIEKYSFDLYNFNLNGRLEYDNLNEYILMRSDFEQLVEDIRTTYISKNYLGLMSWLINRAFAITPAAKGQKDNQLSTLKKNRSVLIKTLYNVNPDAFLSCFIGKKPDTENA